MTMSSGDHISGNIAGDVSGQVVLVNPLVGKLVQSAGDLAAAELSRVIEE